MKGYYRVMLGRKSVHAAECFTGGFMGVVQEALAEKGQMVQGAIIALEDDQRIRRALAVSPSIAFYRYPISFKLLKGL